MSIFFLTLFSLFSLSIFYYIFIPLVSSSLYSCLQKTNLSIFSSSLCKEDFSFLKFLLHFHSPLSSSRLNLCFVLSSQFSSRLSMYSLSLSLSYEKKKVERVGLIGKDGNIENWVNKNDTTSSLFFFFSPIYEFSNLLLDWDLQSH